MREHAVFKAQGLVERYGTRDPFELCDYLNIFVIRCDLPENIYGFYQRMFGSQIIYLNSMLGLGRQRVICAHELGHAVLHEDVNSLFLQEQGAVLMAKYEREADLFLGELLLGDLEEEFDDVYQAAAQTGVPERILKLRYGIYG